MYRYSTIFLTLLVLIGCANNSNINMDNNSSFSKDSNSSYNLDIEDDNYIKLKAQNIDSQTLKIKAKELALAHMKKGEHILANFYIQEALSYDSSDDDLKLLLVKNQYLAAMHNNRDLSYLQKAYKALQENIDLITNDNDKIKAQDMLSKVEKLLAKRNKEIANYYKKIKKDEASTIYENRALELGYVEEKKDNINNDIIDNN